jgi:hypothetical protein
MNNNNNLFKFIYVCESSEKKKLIYENLKGKSGIYCIISKKTNRIYIGSSKNLQTRIRAHFDGKDSERNIILRNALKKEGYNNFIVGIYCY